MPTPVVWLFVCLFVCLLACFSVCYMVDWFTLGVCGRAFDDSCWKFIVRFYFEHPLTFEAVSLSWWPLAERGGGQCVAVNWRTFLPGHISFDPWCFGSDIHVCEWGILVLPHTCIILVRCYASNAIGSQYPSDKLPVDFPSLQACQWDVDFVDWLELVWHWHLKDLTSVYFIHKMYVKTN